MGWGANALKGWKVGRGHKKVETPDGLIYMDYDFLPSLVEKI